MLSLPAQVIFGENVSLGHAIFAFSVQEVNSFQNQVRLNRFYLINQFKSRPLSALDRRGDKRNKNNNTTHYLFELSIYNFCLCLLFFICIFFIIFMLFIYFINCTFKSSCGCEIISRGS